MAMRYVARTTLNSSPLGIRTRLCSSLSSSFPFNPPPLADGESKRPKNDPSTNLFISDGVNLSPVRNKNASMFFTRLKFPFNPPPFADGESKRPKNDSSTNLFISGLNKRTTSDGLRDFAAGFGEVVSARVVTDRATNYSKGFGFVNYASLQDADKGIEGMDGKFLDGWVIFAEYARPRDAAPPQNNPGQFQSRRY